jgi:hypothetical protein
MSFGFSFLVFLRNCRVRTMILAKFQFAVMRMSHYENSGRILGKTHTEADDNFRILRYVSEEGASANYMYVLCKNSMTLKR